MPRPRPICFMVMPYGKRETRLARPGAPTGAATDAPVQVDFDGLWHGAFKPLLEELGYLAVRADQDLGALIIHEMLARLALSDLVLADITMPNANVYYEIGVRHAARETGCVLIAAEGSRATFDIDQMRAVRYPLDPTGLTDAGAAQIRDTLKESVRARAVGQSPLYELLPGFPSKVDKSVAKRFEQFVSDLSDFQVEARAAREALGSDRKARALAVRDRYGAMDPPVAAVALELILLLRDLTDWKTTLDYVETLPKPIAELPLVREQRCLAESELGDPARAIAALKELVRLAGDSSERQGLIAGRYKRLMRDASQPGREAEHSRYLDLAIEHYAAGMRLDLNDYFPSCNLPRLLRLRGRKGDEDRARAAAYVARTACERARERDASDEWLRPTLLGAAFDAGDAGAAQALVEDLRREGPATWKLKTTIADLELSIRLNKDDAQRTALTTMLDELKRLAAEPAAGG